MSASCIILFFWLSLRQNYKSYDKTILAVFLSAWAQNDRKTLANLRVLTPSLDHNCANTLSVLIQRTIKTAQTVDPTTQIHLS